MEFYGITFAHFPISFETGMQANDYFQAMDEASKVGPVFTHCASGYRAAILTTAYVARQGQKCTEWALNRAGTLGFDFQDAANVKIFFHSVLKC